MKLVKRLAGTVINFSIAAGVLAGCTVRKKKN